MTRWINKLDRIVISIRVSIKILWITWVWYNAIGRSKAVNIRDVETGIHVDEANIIAPHIVTLVACKAHIRQVSGGFGAPVAEGEVAGEATGHDVPGRAAHMPWPIAQQAGAAQMVTMQEEYPILLTVWVTTYPRSNRLPCQVVGTALDDSAAIHLLLIPRKGIVDFGATWLNRQQPLPAGIVEEFGDFIIVAKR